MTNKRFFKCIVLFLIVSCSKVYSQPFWSRIQSPVNNDLKDCYFVDANTGWISGSSGTIIKTTNGGVSWKIQDPTVQSDIEDIFFVNENTGWALTWLITPDSSQYPGTYILKTTDGGNVWSKSMFTDTNIFLNTVFFQDSQKGYMGGGPSLIVYTNDGGINWTRADTDTSLIFGLPVYKIKFFDNNTGYACGGFRDIAGIVWVTTNSGVNWKGTMVAPEPFFDVDALSSTKAVVSGGDLEFGSSTVWTTNAGANWHYDTLGVFGLATGISFRTKIEGWMTGSYSRKFLYSIDSGFTWESVYTVDSSSLFDVTFPDSSTGYACGAGGAILKYQRTSSGVNNLSENFSPESFVIHQNHPNPFNPVTKINYELKSEGYVRIVIYDLLGREMEKLIDKKQTQGTYSIQFDASSFSAGIYYCKFYYADDKYPENVISGSMKIVLMK